MPRRLEQDAAGGSVVVRRLAVEVMSRPSRSSSSGTRRPIDRVDDLVGDQPRPRPTRRWSAAPPLSWIHTWAAMPLPTAAVTQSVTGPGRQRLVVEHAGQQRADDAATPCTPNTSSESSAPSRRFRPLTPHRQAEAGDEADDDGAHQADVAGRRGDRHQAGHRTRGRTQHRGLARTSVSPMHQASTAAAVADEGVGEGEHRAVAGFQRRAGVEAEPAHPQQRGRRPWSASASAA